MDNTNFIIGYIDNNFPPLVLLETIKKLNKNNVKTIIISQNNFYDISKESKIISDSHLTKIIYINKSKNYIINNCDVVFTNKFFNITTNVICKKTQHSISIFGKNHIGFYENDTYNTHNLNIFYNILKYYELCSNKNKYDVTILTAYDWCNTGYRYYMGLLQNNVKVQMLKMFAHNIFNYGDEAPYLFLNANIMNKELNDKELNIKSEHVPMYHYKFNNSKFIEIYKKYIQSAKIIYLHAETYIELNKFNYNNKKIIVGVSGHPYRRRPEEFCNFFNKFINKSLIQCPDLLNLGLKNEHLIYYGVDTDNIIPYSLSNNNTILKIGHYPSNPETKGSPDIMNAINFIVKKYPNKFIYDGLNISSNNPNHEKTWAENLKRMGECDIYIETCKPYLNAYSVFKEYNNTKFGEWGNTCLEASALGCIVITNSLTKDYYMENYTQDYPLLIANSYDEIIKQLEYLNTLTMDEIKKLKKKYREWVEKNHSLYMTGKRFNERLIMDNI